MTRRVVVITLTLLLVAGGLWLRFNVDSLVKRAIVHYGSAITQAKVKVGDVEIDSANGRGRIRGLVLGNPHGFHTPYAFKADDILVMSQGEVVERGLAEDIYRNPQHAYTRQLLQAIPKGLAGRAVAKAMA